MEKVKLLEQSKKTTHIIAGDDGESSVVETLFEQGLYAIHREVGEDSYYVVTHKPTGVFVWVEEKQRDAIAACRMLAAEAKVEGGEWGELEAVGPLAVVLARLERLVW